MLITTSIFSAFVYSRAEKRIRKDAGLLMELQLAQLITYMDAHPGAPEVWRTFAERQAESADPELRIGVQFFHPDGREAASVGMATVAERVPADIALGKHEGAPREIDVGWGSPYFVLAGRGTQGIVQLMIYSRPFARSAAGIRDAFISALPVMVLVTAALGWALSRGSLRPISAITKTARRISSHAEETIPTTGSGDELDELAHTLNGMLGRVREGVDRMRRFSVDAAHQLRTPLTAMHSQIDVTLAKERGPEEYRVVLADLLFQVDRLSDTVNAMLRLAQSEGGLEATHSKRVAIDPLLEEVADFFVALAEDRNIEVSIQAESKSDVRGDPVWLHQLFANLVHNAIQYTPDGGRVEVTARPAGGHEIVVRVRDTGPGMTEEDRAIVFSRFERGSASESSEGLGLGLALAREIAHAHGGSIEANNAPGGGAAFVVRLPLLASERSTT
jgi:signal transduction histidine kinase